MVDIAKSREETLKSLGRENLKDVFSGYTPRASRNRKKTAPTDQRVSISVTSREKLSLEKELSEIRKSGDSISISQFVRNRALSSIDINEWREIAEKALEEVEDIYSKRSELRKERRELEISLEDDLDDEDLIACEYRIHQINSDLDKILSRNQSRKYRLSGRLTMMESEVVKWRAQRLCLSTSDFLRMILFDLLPYSGSDAHLSYEAKMRFYISIIDVSKNGWGSPPKIYQCSNCETLEKESENLRKRIKMLESKIVNN